MSQCKFPEATNLKGEELRKQWLAAIRRTNTPVTNNSYVCSQHFVGGCREQLDGLANLPFVRSMFVTHL